jgi:CBS domain
MAEKQSLVEILKGVKVADLPGVKEVITVTSDDSVQEGFQKLADHQILSAPVWDLKNEEYTGFLDVRDLVSWVVFIDDDENAEIPSELSHLIGHGARYFKLPVENLTTTCAFPPSFPYCSLLRATAPPRLFALALFRDFFCCPRGVSTSRFCPLFGVLPF